MKAFLGLGVLCLLACLIWADYHPVTVECTLFMFRVTVRKNLFGSGVPVRAVELTLGSGCPVNSELPDTFELFYSVSECGITFLVFETHVIYKTNLHYVPLNPVFGYHSRDFPLACKVFKEIEFSDSEEDETILPEKKRRAVKMWPSVIGSNYWTPKLRETLENQQNDLSERQVKSCDLVSSLNLTQHSSVCRLCHGDIALLAS
ncbi:putative oocyte-secreted protein 1 homolog [Sminthopsis crassicaudata]|uniref:putative oocyte-secreted protein 1 homolog n=1 Tax=Sminthopsis crassicaudata TaxID=9301 RepID=UPI003D68E2A9